MKKNNMLRIIKKIVPMVINAAPLQFIVNVLFCITHGTMWGVITIVQQRFFDEISEFVSGNLSMKSVIISLIIMGGAYLFVHTINGIENCQGELLKEYISGKLCTAIHKKVSKLPTEKFEDTECLTDINKATEGKNNAVSFVFTIKDILCFYVPYFLVMTMYLFSLKPLLALSTMFVFWPIIITQIVRTRVFDQLENKSAPIRREYEYYETCVTSREYYKETRMLGAFQYFKKLYLDVLDNLNNMKYKANIRTYKIELMLSMLTVLGYSGILLMLFQALVNKEISAGAFASIFYSIGTLYTIMEEVVFYEIGGVFQDYGTIRNFVNFNEMEEKSGKNIEIDWGDVVLDNVSYRYPNSDQIALKNVSFTWNKGETIAIVGENGAGKSTLAKIAIGMYGPMSRFSTS